MEIYLHDSAAMFRFVLRGQFSGDHVASLRNAWVTAQSILETKDLVVDISGVTHTDLAGAGLLSQMHESGAHLIAVLPTADLDLVRSIGVPVLSFVERRRASLLVRFARAVLRRIGFGRNNRSAQLHVIQTEVAQEKTQACWKSIS